jgi:hypothetical protein
MTTPIAAIILSGRLALALAAARKDTQQIGNADF